MKKFSLVLDKLPLVSWLCNPAVDSGKSFFCIFWKILMDGCQLFGLGWESWASRWYMGLGSQRNLVTRLKILELWAIWLSLQLWTNLLEGHPLVSSRQCFYVGTRWCCRPGLPSCHGKSLPFTLTRTLLISPFVRLQFINRKFCCLDVVQAMQIYLSATASFR